MTRRTLKAGPSKTARTTPLFASPWTALLAHLFSRRAAAVRYLER